MIVFLMHTFIYITIFAVSSALINAFGILAIAKQRKWVEKVKTYAICFAAGMLISTPLVLALPNAVNAATKPYYAGLLALAGFIFMLLSNRFIQFKTKQSSLAFGITAAEGIAIHSLVDGIIYTVAFSHSIMTGVVAATGLVIHEFAEGIITYLFFLKSDIPNKKAKWYAFLVAGLTTPIGAFVTYPFMSLIPPHILALLLGFVGGVLIYISASHLLFEAQKNQDENKDKHSILALLLGVALALVIVFTNIFG
ncbi:MAG: ZIP family metal transporter [Candidatus Lokiarchaeota archaeon]|nr:ZIP family metal transporter [Candidatus Lokiarchaeota archaeon]